MANKKTKPVKYSSKEFDSIKDSLVNYAKTYYPDTFKDFNASSFGSLMLDTVAYVGDMLSFYLDYQVNESFLETAVEYDNISRLTKNIGYKTPGRPAAFGMATFYVAIPANSSESRDAPPTKTPSMLAPCIKPATLPAFTDPP